MNFKEILTRLYFILICSDGHVNEKEVSYGRKMVETEGIDEQFFFSQIKLLESKEQEPEKLAPVLGELKKLSRAEQIRCIAWLCIIANADGFMDKAEWQMIYKIYHKELNLPLDDIMKTQKELNANLYRNVTSPISVIRV